MGECRHATVVTWGTPDNRLWACASCSRRMYPACETCVSVGHRNETHPESGTGDERLREALTIASEFENEARESLYALRAAAEAYLDAQQALVVWDAKHGYVTNSERDGLSMEVSLTEAALRDALPPKEDDDAEDR